MTTTHSAPQSATAADPMLSAEVVVGYDGSWHSRPALVRAAAEASARGLPLRVLSVVESWDENEAERRAGRSPEESSPEQEWQRATAKAAAVVHDLATTEPTLT